MVGEGARAAGSINRRTGSCCDGFAGSVGPSITGVESSRCVYLSRTSRNYFHIAEKVAEIDLETIARTSILAHSNTAVDWGSEPASAVDAPKHLTMAKQSAESVCTALSRPISDRIAQNSHFVWLREEERYERRRLDQRRDRPV